MIWIDFTLIGFIFIFFIIGLLRGFFKEIFSLIFWILAAWISLMFSREFSIFLQSTISHPLPRMTASFIALFAITLSFLGGMVFDVVRVSHDRYYCRYHVGWIYAVAQRLPVDRINIVPSFLLLAIELRDHLSSEMADDGASGTSGRERRMERLPNTSVIVNSFR